MALGTDVVLSSVERRDTPRSSRATPTQRRRMTGMRVAPATTFITTVLRVMRRLNGMRRTPEGRGERCMVEGLEVVEDGD